MSGRPAKRDLCWIYLCPNLPTTTARLTRPYPERPPIVRVCAACAARFKRTPIGDNA